MTIHARIKKLSRRITNFKRRAQEAYGRHRDRWPVFVIERYEEMKAKAEELRAREARI